MWTSRKSIGKFLIGTQFCAWLRIVSPESASSVYGWNVERLKQEQRKQINSRLKGINHNTSWHHNLPIDWARELFKPSKMQRVFYLKLKKTGKFWNLGFWWWLHNWSSFTHFWQRSPGPGRNPTSQCLAQVFLETRL